MKITLLASGTVTSNFTYRVLQLSRSLVKRGHNVSIIVPTADKYNDFKFEKIKEIDGVKIIQPFQFRTKRLELNLLPYIIHVSWIMLTNKSDLIYVYKPTPITVVGLLGKFIYRTELVLDMDDLGSEVMKIEGHPQYQVRLVEWCENIVAKYADRIVTASTYLKEHFRKQYQNKPILVMSNAVDSDWFNPIEWSQEKNRIVFLGALNRQNILEPLFDVLPNVVKKVPDVKVLIMGDGKFLSFFKQKVRDFGLDAVVDFTGWMSIKDAKSKLLAGDLGYNFMPDDKTTRAASNMKVPQYMARGVVPLVSKVGDLPSYVDNGKVGYIANSDDLKSLESNMILALNDTERLKKAQGASQFSQTTFSWDILAQKFDDWVNGKNESNISNKGKKIYFVNVSVPGNVGGPEIRNFHLLKAISNLPNSKVTSFSISTHNIEGDKRNLESMVFSKNIIVKKSVSTLFRRLKSVFWDGIPPFMNDFTASRIGEVFRKECEMELPDVVQIQQVHAYYAIRDHIKWLKEKGVKIVLDCHNIEFQSFNESLDIFSTGKKLTGKLMVNNLKKLEIEAVKNSDVVFCCSSIDAQFFLKYNKNTYVIPNGVDIEEFNKIKDSTLPNLIFVGGIGYPPNEDAMLFYIKNIHPLIKKEVPDVKLYAIGMSKDWYKGKGFDDASILPLGFVPEINQYLKSSAVGICPLRYGSGTRLKILTYMAANLPVVSTYKGAEGIDYENGNNIFMEDDPKLFAGAVVSLLKDKALAEKIGRNGFEFAKANFDWKVIGEDALNIYNKI